LSVIEKGFECLRRRSGGGVREVLKEIEELARTRNNREKTELIQDPEGSRCNRA